jgi:large subunit ribosomal protein L5
LSRGVGAAVSDKKLIDYAVDELTKITGKKSDIYTQRKMLHL